MRRGKPVVKSRVSDQDARVRTKGSLNPRKTGRGMCVVLLTAAALWVAGCTARYHRTAADKEVYNTLAARQGLVTNMDPRFTIEQTNLLSFEGLAELSETNDFLGPAGVTELGARIVALEDALRLAVTHSRVYQNSKEQLYLSALSLSLVRHTFTPVFSAGGAGTYSEDVQAVGRSRTNAATGEIEIVTSEEVAQQARVTGRVGVDWLVRDIGRLSAAFTTDFLRVLSGGPSTMISSQVGATFTRPLLRNSGFKAEMETLTQSERDLLYQLRDFVRFRKSFSVRVAAAYYGVLGSRDAARNAFQNLLGSRRAGDRTRSLAAEGRTTQTDLGRIEQQELTAENAWTAAVRSYQRALDDFKILLGIPVSTRLVLDDRDLRELRIQQPGMSLEDSIQVALAARLDYQNAQEQVEDADRKVKLAADRFKPQFDLVLAGGFRSPSETHGFPVPDPDLYYWNAGGNVDLPVDQKPAQNAYRAALIAEERSRRAAEQLRDEIEQQVRESWRTLEQARTSYEISDIGVSLAQRRVEEQELLAELGRARALDQIDAQNALIESMDQRTQALVAHTIARLQFWENLGILYIKDQGQWEEGPLAAGESERR